MNEGLKTVSRHSQHKHRSQKFPDFYLVGAPKCGTTTMASYLDLYEEVFLPSPREVSFFGSDTEYLRGSGSLSGYRLSQEEYLSRFADARVGQVVGASPIWYLHSKKAAKELHATVPNAKIIISLREPVSFLRSFHAQMVFSGNETISDFWDALDAEPRRRSGVDLPPGLTIRQSVYYSELVYFSNQVKRFLDTFEPTNVLVLLLDDFKSQPDDTAERICDFLGVGYRHDIPFVNDNPRRQVRSRALNIVMRRPPNWLRSAVGVFPGPVKSLIYRTGKKVNTRYVSSSLSKGMDPRECTLRERYFEEIDRLGELIGRDLENWKKGQSVWD